MFHPELNRMLVLAGDLINTAPGLRSGAQSDEELTTVESLKGFLAEHDLTDWPTSRLDRPQLERVLALRGTLHRIWSDSPLEADGGVAPLNSLLSGVGTTLVAAPEEESGLRAEPVPVTRELSDVMTAHMAYALAQLVILAESARLRICRGEECEAAIVDLTRNRSKQFCDFGNCANRAHVRAYRARKAAEREAARRGESASSSKRSAPLDESKLAKPSSRDKAAQLDEPTSEAGIAAKEFRSRMREELMDSRAKQEKKGKKRKKKGKDGKKK